MVFVVGFMLTGAGVGVALTADLRPGGQLGRPRTRRCGVGGRPRPPTNSASRLGVAVLGSVVMAIFRRGLDVAGLSDEQSALARETVGAASSVANGLAEPATFLTSVQESFVTGMHVASAITVVVLAVAAINAARLHRR